MKKLHIIVGSTRDGRAAEPVAQWVHRRAKEHGGFDVTLLDLRDWPLPMFAETMATIGDFASPTYSDPIVRRWNQTIAEGDAFIFITPEYNHSFSGVLKNAIDSVFVSWAFRNKPAAFVAYSGGPVGGARAVEQLALVLIAGFQLMPRGLTVQQYDNIACEAGLTLAERYSTWDRDPWHEAGDYAVSVHRNGRGG